MVQIGDDVTWEAKQQQQQQQQLLGRIWRAIKILLLFLAGNIRQPIIGANEQCPTGFREKATLTISSKIQKPPTNVPAENPLGIFSIFKILGLIFF